MSAVSSTLEQPVAAGIDVPSDQHPNLSPLRRLLPELVRAMGWQRSERVLQSAITESGPLTIDGVVQALRRIGFVVRATQELPEEWRLGDDAALVRVSRSGEVEATVRRTGVTRRVDPDRPDDTSTSPRFRAAQFLLIVDAAASPLRHTDPTEAWSPALRRVVRGVFWLSFFINLLALSVPIFSMQIYDRVIGGGAPEVLPWFALGAVLSLVLMLVLRRQRSRLLAGVHSRLGYHLSLAVADRMLRLPLLVAGKLRRAALVSRLRELERMRDRFAAANTVAVFDAPFVLLTLVAVAFVGGWLVIIPAVYLIAFWLLANRVSSYVAAGARASGQASAERDAMLTDLADHGPALTASRSAPGWSRRFLEVSAEAVRGGYIQGTRLGLAQSLAYVLGTGTALATLVFGLELVLVGAMTPGGLIASMLLIWRITAPAQALFMSVGRLQQTEAAKEKVQRFFGAAYDGDDAGKRMPVPSEPQSLEFDRVSFRYSADQEAALAGVSFRIEPGEMLAVVGPNGAGKTTLLRLAAGLLEPQGGLVMMGGRNLKQFDPEEYRLSVGYYPEHPATFSGTLAQNLRAAVPGATDKELTAVMQLAWPANLSQYLVDGLDTKLPLSQSKGLALEDDQRLGLTQLIARSSPLLLISDPVENTGPDAPKHLKAFVEEAKALFRLWHGRRTIVLVSQNPELLAFADKALVLDKGQVIHFGPIQKPEAGEAGQTTGTAE